MTETYTNKYFNKGSKRTQRCNQNDVDTYSGKTYFNNHKNYTKNIRCNNCGLMGHFSKNCSKPITSYGIILLNVNCSQNVKEFIYNCFNVAYKYDSNKNETIHTDFSMNKSAQELFCKSKDLVQFLMISRKHSIGYMEFLRGRYKINDIDGIQSLFKQMLPEEIKKISTLDFAQLWDDMWSNSTKDKYNNNSVNNKSNDESNINRVTKKISNDSTDSNESSNSDNNILECTNRTENVNTEINNKTNNKEFYKNNNAKINYQLNDFDSDNLVNRKSYHNDFLIAQKKFEKIKNAKNMQGIFPLDWYIKKTRTIYTVNEWGFPKGRKNFKESNLECACREFEEETGLVGSDFKIFDNILPIEEIFTGTDGVVYKYVYYVAGLINNQISLDVQKLSDLGEVGDIGWFNYDEAFNSIRPYHTARLHILTNFHLHLLNLLMQTADLIHKIDLNKETKLIEDDNSSNDSDDIVRKNIITKSKSNEICATMIN